MGRRYDEDEQLDLTLVGYNRRSTNSKKEVVSHHDSRAYRDDKRRREYKEPQRKKKKKKRKGIRVLWALIKFFVIIGILMFLAVKYVPGAKQFLLSNCGGALLKMILSEDTYNSIFDDDFDRDDIKVNEGIDRDKFEGYYTIALFGIDSRDEKMDAGVNADAILLVSINQDTGKVVLSSVYRDTWLNIYTDSGESSYRKINSAFCSGGVKSAMNTMNKNFDLNISDYVTINFQGLATIIDMLGGLDMTITEDEKYYINHYMDENRRVTGIDSPDVTQSGKVHLTGLQAVAYCRIRYCAYYYEDGTSVNNDMGRTARQRYVLSLMIEKAKTSGVKKVLDIAESVFSGEENIVRTSIAYDDMMEMIPSFIDFELGETKGFPFTYEFPDKSLTNGESAMAVGGLVYNVKQLHSFLYGDEAYMPSQTVQDIDVELKEITGVDDKYLP